MSAEFQFDVFLSHNVKDKAVVRPLAERLRKDGLKVWFHEWECPSPAGAGEGGRKPGEGRRAKGDSIPAKIEEGLERSRALVLCMSAQAFGSDWAQWASGMCGRGNLPFRDPLNKERRFIPLRLDDAPSKGSLAQFRHINWHPAEREQKGLQVRKMIAQSKRSETSAALGEPFAEDVSLSSSNDDRVEVRSRDSHELVRPCEFA